MIGYQKLIYKHHMNKPPERIRIVQSNNPPYIFYYSDKPLSEFTPGHTEYFYTLEKEPMEMKIITEATTTPMTPVSHLYINQKTENLTTQEAWAAMARGECVDTVDAIHAIKGNRLFFWTAQAKWVATSLLNEGPYSIVPDPSKPKEVEKSKYEKDRKNLIKHLDTATWKYSERPGDMTDMILDLIEEHFQRKP